MENPQGYYTAKPIVCCVGVYHVSNVHKFPLLLITVVTDNKLFYFFVLLLWGCVPVGYVWFVCIYIYLYVWCWGLPNEDTKPHTEQQADTQVSLCKAADTKSSYINIMLLMFE